MSVERGDAAAAKVKQLQELVDQMKMAANAAEIGFEIPDGADKDLKFQVERLRLVPPL